MEIEIFSGDDEFDDQQLQAANSNSRKGKKKYHRHSAYQIQRLEAVFKEFPHPDENQRRELGRELGLDPKQVKFWFQNKRTQRKAQNERSDNGILRSENERIHCENVAIQEALKNVNCDACGGPSCGSEERKRNLKKLQLQNAKLKEEHHRVTTLVAKYTGKPLSEIENLTTLPKSSLGLSVPLRNFLINNRVAMKIRNNQEFPNHQMNGTIDMERALIVETAASAMDEVTKLLQIDEPLWIKSPSEGRCILHRGSYEKIFPTRASFNIRSFTNSARFESSKHSGIVTMSAMHLVDAFLDSNKWGDIFPTIVTKEKTIQALEKGAFANRHGSLHMMYEKMHILSPLVPSREFCFLRHCRQIEHGTWVIADVSYDFSKGSVFPSRSWRLPSGCMIEDMSNGSSKVTWVEHVHVDDKSRTNRLYRDLVCGSHNIAYGAERWILTLKRMCERFTYFCKLPETTATADNGFGRVIIMAEGKQSVMNLSHRMVKNFCGTLNMSGKLDFPQLAEVTNSGVRVSVREATETGQPSGIIVGAATSLRLPLPPQAVFDFFKDDKTRFQWDVLSNGYPVHEIEHISTGDHPGNCISIIRPFIPTENNMLMLQESCIDRLGSLIVYAPIDVTTLNMAITGQDFSAIPILPSGFIISADGRGTNHRSPEAASTSSSNGPASGISSSGGSLLTVAFQILVSCKQLNVESVAAVNTLISSTVQKIKSSLNCSNDLD